MINSESPIVMNCSAYILPPARHSASTSDRILKSSSLSNLEVVPKNSSLDFRVNRRNSVSGAPSMDTNSSSTASVDALVGPFKSLEEAQIAATLLKQKPAHSVTPVTANPPAIQKINGMSAIMSTRLQKILSQNKILSNSNKVHLNKPKEFKCQNPLSILSTVGHGNLQLYSSSDPGASKMQTGLCSSVTSDVKSEAVIKVETFPSSCWEQIHQDSQVSLTANPSASKNQTGLCMSVTPEPQVSSVVKSEDVGKAESLLPSIKKGTVAARNCLADSAANPYVLQKNAPVKKKSTKRKKESIPSFTNVASLVFFDLETTGLAFEIGKSNVQITEVSMVAINRKEFEQSTLEDLGDIRIIQKLCLCTRPRSMVSSGAAAVTGLNKENLMVHSPFERNAAETINFFLSHLPKPVCLLAHNGNRYDFPLLKAEFNRISMSLPSDILIADTLKAFRVLGVPVFPPEKKICESVKFTKRGQVSYSLPNLHLYFFNKNPTGSHSSEGDCIALAKVCHRMKDLMLLWVDENCTTFDSVSPMW